MKLDAYSTILHAAETPQTTLTRTKKLNNFKLTNIFTTLVAELEA